MEGKTLAPVTARLHPSEQTFHLHHLIRREDVKYKIAFSQTVFLDKHLKVILEV